MSFGGRRHPAVVLVTLALTVIGLIGTYNYWESYYQHRGFATVAYLPHAKHVHPRAITFYSPALHRQADYFAYLPPGYATSHRRYPVFYLLHGSPGRPQVYRGIASMPVRMANLISRHEMRPMILVFPDGRIGGSTYSDSEWANTRAGNYENYVVDVVHDVDHRFRTLRGRSDRVIAGFSAGAYGATNVLLHHLSVFGNLESWSGYYKQNRTGVFAHASRADLAYNSPLDWIATHRAAVTARPIRAFLFVGRDDDDSPQTPPMAQALASAGAAVSYALYHGGHDWQLWHAHLNQMLELASRDTELPTPRAHGRAQFLTPGAVPLPHGLGRRHRRTVALREPPVLLSTPETALRRHRRLRRLPRIASVPGAVAP